MFTNGKPELMESTMRELKNSFSDDLVSLKKALESENEQMVRSIAHKIKPNFLLIGINKIGQLCKEIENEVSSEELIKKTKILLEAMPIIISEINDFTYKNSLQKVQSS